jgi:hypothetical protein
LDQPLERKNTKSVMKTKLYNINLFYFFILVKLKRTLN